MKKLVLILTGLSILCWSAFALEQPKLVKSEYLKVENAGFSAEFSKPLKVQYVIWLSRRKLLKQPLYLKLYFQNPNNKKKPITLLAAFPEKEDTMEFYSKEFKGIKNRKFYEIEVKVYRDKARTQLLDRLRQKVLFEIEKELWERTH